MRLLSKIIQPYVRRVTDGVKLYILALFYSVDSFLAIKHWLLNNEQKDINKLEGYSRHSRQPSLNNSHLRISHC